MNEYTNGNNSYNGDNSFNNEGLNTNNTPINDNVSYNSYYNHQPRKKPWAIIIALIIVAIGIVISLWFAGVFTPLNRQAEYQKLYKRVCTAAVEYANTKYADSKTTGQIIYVTVGNLIDANKIEANLTNYLTDEAIPSTTDIKLEVLPSGTLQCHGFVWPGDDKVKPVITLVGDATIRSGVGVKVTDPGATATDDQDGDISNKIERSGSVNINQAGTYTVTYVVSDRAGNISDRVIRTFVIQ